MGKIDLIYLDGMQHVMKHEFDAAMADNQSYLKEILDNTTKYQDSLGWLNPSEWAGEDAVTNIIEKADEVRRKADVFVLVGIGGSNQAARAVIKALQNDDGPEILYAGNNISAHYVSQLMKKLEGKSVYINVIAKNFETLEPGIGFRVLRKYLEKRYGQEANTHITVTGTKGNRLHEISIENGYEFLEFPSNIGGRYSVLSDVGLYPMAVAGIDIKSLVQGTKDMQTNLYNCDPKENTALIYATYRNLLLQKGYNIEMMAFFEPQLHFFSKWWIQLFAESEGKDNKGIYPVAVNYSEDLHSVGQYVQDGQKILFETFIDIAEQNGSVILTKDNVDDRFDYLNGKDFWDINKAAFEATIGAHSDSGIPCLRLTLPRLNEYYFGQMFYLLEFACYISGSILGVNPFDQPGVENYKGYMFNKLGKFNESV